MTNLHEILDKARAARQRLPPNEAAVLFAAAVRLAAAQGGSLRSRLLQLDDAGGLHLAPLDERAPETEPGYLAPELRGADAPRKNEPRVQVYAAGALGYELLTGHVPPGNPAELSGPLGDIVRMALAPDRRERFADLQQLQEAVEAVRPRPPPEGERNIFTAVRNRWTRGAPMEKEALARLIEKLTQLEAQAGQLAKAQARLEGAQRDALERIDRFEDGQQRLRKPAPSAFGPALLAAVIAAAAAVGAGWALGLFTGARAPAPVAQQAPAPAPTPAPEVPDAAVAEEKPAPDASAEAAAEKTDAGEAAPAEASDAAAAEAAQDAGTIARVPAPPAAAKRRKGSQTDASQAAMLHAVAVSQVRRGESALAQNNPAEAVAAFKAALENEPALPVAFRGMGMAYAMQGQDAQALKAYQKYLQLAPAAPDKTDIQRAISELKARSSKAAEGQQ